MDGGATSVRRPERCGLVQRGGDDDVVGVMYPCLAPDSDADSEVGPTLTIDAEASDGESPLTLTLTERRGAKEPSDISDPDLWCSAQLALGWREDAREPAPVAHPGPITGPGGGGSDEESIRRTFLMFGSVCLRSSIRISASYMSCC